MEGKLLAIEGIDCSGKTTLVELIKQELVFNGFQPKILEEFGSVVGQFFFEKVISNDLGLTLPAQVLIRAAGQISELFENSDNLTDEKTILLADRYIDSNVVYQSVGYMLHPEKKHIPNETFQNWARSVYGAFYIEPFVTFILDLPVEAAIERAKANNEPIKPVKFLEFARDEYLILAKNNVHKYQVIDATQPPSKTLPIVMDYILAILSSPGQLDSLKK